MWRLFVCVSLLVLVGCSSRRKTKFPPLPPGVQARSGVQPLIQGGEAFVDPKAIRLSLTATNGIHVEYSLAGTNTFANFGHCCPITGVEITFPTAETNLYFVQVNDSLEPVRMDVNSLGQVYGFSRVDIHRPAPTNTTSYLTNTSWFTLSQAIPGTGSNVTWRGNIVYSNAFFRVRIM